MSFEGQIMSKDKYSSIILCKMVAAKIFDGLSVIISRYLYCALAYTSFAFL